MSTHKELQLARSIAKEFNISEEAMLEVLHDAGYDLKGRQNLKLTHEQILVVKNYVNRNSISHTSNETKEKKTVGIVKNRVKKASASSYSKWATDVLGEVFGVKPDIDKMTEKVNSILSSGDDDDDDDDDIDDEISHNEEENKDFISSASSTDTLIVEDNIDFPLSVPAPLPEENNQDKIEPQIIPLSIAKRVETIIEEYINVGETFLDLSSLGLDEIPESLLMLDNLKILNISDNNINKLENLPSILNELHLTNNHITDLSGVPPELRVLAIAYNNLKEIDNLPDSLIRLDAAVNEISRIKKLPSQLVDIDLNNNLLQAITITNNVNSLRICHNQINSITQIEGLEYIDELYLYGNPIQDLPQHLLGDNEEFNCISSVRSWLTELERKSEKNTHVKLILLGNSNVGKSSIIRALKNLPHNPDIQSTHGISIETLTIKDDDQPVNLQVWDLGGQEIYYGTHRMFMMSQSVQLVVFDTQTEAISVTPDRLKDTEKVRNIKLSFYVNRVQELSPQSQIIIVQNKTEEDNNTPEYLVEYLAKNRYEKVSTITKRNIRSLFAKVHDAAIDLNIYGQPVPYYWERVRKYISNNLSGPEDKRLRIINKTQFKALCLKEKVLEEGIDDLLGHLHNIGALYYRSELEDNIIIDQVWALKAIYQIFDRDSDFYFEMRNVYHGKCSIRSIFADFDKTSKSYTIDEKWIFIKYMQSCGLCFAVKHNNNEPDTLDTFCVFPEFLPSVKPNFVKLWDLKKATRQVIQKRYKFLPYYTLHKFISKFGTKTMHNFLWRNGILICMDGETFDGFLVEADFENHTIRITFDETMLEWKDAIISQLEIGKEIDGEEWNTFNTDPLTKPMVVQKAPAELLNIENVVKNLNEGLPLQKKRRLVISYAKEDADELNVFIEQLGGYHVDIWFDKNLTNRANWDDEINQEFENADGFVILVSASYMNKRKEFIHKTEIPLIFRRFNEKKLFCSILVVKPFSLDSKIHGDICKIPIYNKGKILPSVINDKHNAGLFLNDFVCEEILKKL